jgi:ribosomal protein L9
MTDKKYQEEANALVAQKFEVTKNCIDLKTKIQNIGAEITTRSELYASGSCKNKLFSKEDCRQEQKNYLPILRKRELELTQAYNANKCDVVFGDIEAKKTQDAIDKAYAEADKELGAGLRMQEYLIYGVGLLVVGFGIYYFTKKR